MMRNWSKLIVISVFLSPILAVAQTNNLSISSQSNSTTTPKVIKVTPIKSDKNAEREPDLEKISEDKTMQVYIDKNTIEWTKDRVGFWKMLDLYERLKDGALSLYSYDIHFCGKKLLQRISVIHYRGQFASGKEISKNDKVQDIERIKPGSVDDVIDEYVCKLKK